MTAEAKRRDILPQEQEHKDIQAIKAFIKAESPTSISDISDAEPGPTDDDTLRMIGLSRTEQARRVVSGLDQLGKVNYVSDGYIETTEEI